jgi:hypothetical protein
MNAVEATRTTRTWWKNLKLEVGWWSRWPPAGAGGAGHGIGGDRLGETRRNGEREEEGAWVLSQNMSQTRRCPSLRHHDWC